MSNTWQRLDECLYFCGRFGPGLLRVLLPILVPAFLLKHFRIWWALGGNQGLVDQDVLIIGLELAMGLFATAATLAYGGHIVKGEPVTAPQARREALIGMAPLFLVQILVGFAFAGGLVFFILPGLWVLACLMPAYAYVVIDRQPVMQALQQSFHTFRPLAWQLLGSLLVITLSLAAALTLIDGLMNIINQLVPWLRMVLGASLDILWVLLTQLLPILLLRFYDLGREAVADVNAR